MDPDANSSRGLGREAPPISWFLTLLLVSSCTEQPVVIQAMNIGSNRVSFPDVGASLGKPEGFVESTRAFGIDDEDRPGTAGVHVMRLPRPYTDVIRQIRKASFDRIGLDVTDRQLVQVTDGSGYLIRGRQRIGRSTFAKWLLYFGDDHASILVTGIVPVDSEPPAHKTVEAIVLSARSSAYEPGHSLPIRVQHANKLQVTPGALRDEQVWTLRGAVPESEVGPIFRARVHQTETPPRNRKAFARNTTRRLEGVSSCRIQSCEEVKVGGMPGVEIEATAIGKAKRSPLSIYCLVLFDEQRHYVLSGSIGTAQVEEYRDEFRKMAHSVARAR